VSAETLSAFQRQAPDLFAAAPVSQPAFSPIARLPRTGRVAVPGRLDELELDAAGVGDDLLKALSISPHATGLRRLGLCENRVGPAGAAALARSPYLTRRDGTASGRQRLETRGRGPWPDSPNLTRLTVLDLFDNGVTDDGARALADSRTSAGWRCWTSAAIATRSPMRGRWHWPGRPACRT